MNDRFWTITVVCNILFATFQLDLDPGDLIAHLTKSTYTNQFSTVDIFKGSLKYRSLEKMKLERNGNFVPCTKNSSFLGAEFR